jgi:hypothetical protein
MWRLSAAILLCTYSLAVMGSTHCSVDEVTYFSCQIKNSKNVMSLCGSSLQGMDATSFLKDGWLQYRFGKLGSNEVFVYPTSKEGSVHKFKGEFHSFVGEENARGYSGRVWFENGKAEYGVIDDEGSHHFYGVWVNVGKRHRRFPCDDPQEIDFGSWNGDGFTSLIRHLPLAE